MWTSAGVVLGVGAVVITGWQRLDAVVALAVTANISYPETTLVRRSARGVMDRALDKPTQDQIARVLSSFEDAVCGFTPCASGRPGRRAFISTHVLVPA